MNNDCVLQFTGLGSDINAICGKDWDVGGGDHGDPGNFQWINHTLSIVLINVCLPDD